MIHKLKGNFETREVWLDGKRLSPKRSQKVWNHSPDGFSWGYAGSGPAQLALAVCLEIMDEWEAKSYYPKFKWDIIAKLPQSDFEITIDTRPNEEGWEIWKKVEDNVKI